MLELRQRPGGAVTARLRDGAALDRLRPELPDRCRPGAPPSPGALTFDCGPQGLAGARVAVRGLAPGQEVLLLVELPGRSLSAVLRRDAAELLVPAAEGAAATLRAYLGLGATHIAAGHDHLLFLLCLLALVSGPRQLLWTVTAFTAAHSLSLALAALGLLRLPSPPVEAAIALSIALLAAELCRPTSPLLLRRPYAAAFAFGLVHGLGFAGALGEAGLPEGQVAAALLGFNAGVELGQLAFLAALLALLPAARALRGFLMAALPARVHSYASRRGLGYVVGSIAALWFWQRLGAVLAAR